jgi:hypothetical protein
MTIPDPLSTEPRQCAGCGQTFPARLGRLIPAGATLRWFCHFCADVRRDLPRSTG